MAQIRRVTSLDHWYSSEDAKRSFGGICQRLNEAGSEVALLGTPESPLLVLRDAKGVPEESGDLKITIDEAKSDWSAVTTAAALFGTRFRIQGKKMERAVLSKHPEGQHPAEQYRRSPSPDANKIAEQIEKLAKEVRKIGARLSKSSLQRTEDLRHAADKLFQSVDVIDRKLARSADIIERRFREAWRLGQGYPADPGICGDGIVFDPMRSQRS